MFYNIRLIILDIFSVHRTGLRLVYIIFLNVSQEKLNGLTILSIEQDLLENIKYKKFN
jgi:hypothetical protein